MNNIPIINNNTEIDDEQELINVSFKDKVIEILISFVCPIVLCVGILILIGIAFR
jgi:hypothetical protein